MPSTTVMPNLIEDEDDPLKNGTAGLRLPRPIENNPLPVNLSDLIQPNVTTGPNPPINGSIPVGPQVPTQTPNLNVQGVQVGNLMDRMIGTALTKNDAVQAQGGMQTGSYASGQSQSSANQEVSNTDTSSNTSTFGSSAGTTSNNTQSNMTGNTSSVGGSNMTGTTNTSGLSSTTGRNTGIQSNSGFTNNIGTTTGTSINTGTNTSQQQQTGESTNRRSVDDTVGISSLLRDAGTKQSQAGDSATSFLNDVMNTGGSQFQSQLDAAIRSATSGPEFTGAGRGGVGRAAGMAASQVARENLNSRLNAADQLRQGNVGLAGLVDSSSRFAGTTDTGRSNVTAAGTSASTNTGLNTGTSTNTGVSSNTSVSDSTNQQTTANQQTTNTAQNEQNFNNTNTTQNTNTAQAGTNTQQNAQSTQANQRTATQTIGQALSQMLAGGSSAGASVSAGQGTNPPVAEGGTIMCTAYHLGHNIALFEPKYHRSLIHAISRHRTAHLGYLRLFRSVAKEVANNSLTAAVWLPISQRTANEITYRITGQGKRNPWLHRQLFIIFYCLCWLIGKWTRLQSRF